MRPPPSFLHPPSCPAVLLPSSRLCPVLPELRQRWSQLAGRMAGRMGRQGDGGRCKREGPRRQLARTETGAGAQRDLMTDLVGSIRWLVVPAACETFWQR